MATMPLTPPGCSRKNKIPQMGDFFKEQIKVYLSVILQFFIVVVYCGCFFWSVSGRLRIIAQVLNVSLFGHCQQRFIVALDI